MPLRLSRAETVRAEALEAVDRHFAKLIASEIGPLGALYALKRQHAEAGRGALIDGDLGEILARAHDQDERLAALDRRRRTLKAAIRQAKTAAEIGAIQEAM